MRPLSVLIALLYGLLAPISAQDSSTLIAGEHLLLTATADGNPAPTFQWRKDGANLASGATYEVAAVSSANAGSYTVIATNVAGTAISPAYTITVNEAPPPPTPTESAPVFTLQPASVTAKTGETATFRSLATGNPSYRWWRNGVTFDGWTTPDLSLPALTTNDEGVYTVVATNSTGSATSNVVTLTLLPSPPPAPPPSANVAPTIITHPTSVTVARGSAVQFTVAFNGVPTPVVQWMKNGLSIPGETTTTLSFPEVTDSHSALYLARVSNSEGTVRSNEASLTIFVPPPPLPPQSKPTITTQPKSLAQNAKTVATFTVVATGVPAPTYQWFKDGKAIGGADSATLQLRNVNRGSRGTYTVVVKNALGSVTSAPATLTVN